MSRFRRGSVWPSIASRFLMELPRDEMSVFEPVSNHFDEQSVADSISQIDPWMHDGIPSFDVNEVNLDVNDSNDESDSVSESPATFSLSSDTKTETKPTFPRIVTGAQIAAEQEAMTSHVRLHPESYQIGMDVEHPEYGVGTVTGLTGEGQKRTATIEFAKLGKKRFRLAFCNLSAV